MALGSTLKGWVHCRSIFIQVTVFVFFGFFSSPVNQTCLTKYFFAVWKVFIFWKKRVGYVGTSDFDEKRTLFLKFLA